MVLRAHSKTVSGFYLLLFLQRIEIVLLYRSNQVDLGRSVSLEVLSNVIDRKAFGMQIKTNMALNCIFSLILTVIKSFWVELISADFIYLEVHVNEESTASRYRSFSTLEQEVHFLRETAVCFTLLPWKFCVCVLCWSEAPWQPQIAASEVMSHFSTWRCRLEEEMIPQEFSERLWRERILHNASQEGYATCLESDTFYRNAWAVWIKKLEIPDKKHLNSALCMFYVHTRSWWNGSVCLWVI